MIDEEGTTRRHLALQLLGCTIFTALLLDVAPALAQDKPNIVFIPADNVGYGDLGSYAGGELRGAPTPRLDQLATERLRLTQFLVEPACTPSKASPVPIAATSRRRLRSRPH
jgi:Sulfatase